MDGSFQLLLMHDPLHKHVLALHFSSFALCSIFLFPFPVLHVVELLCPHFFILSVAFCSYRLFPLNLQVSLTSARVSADLQFAWWLGCGRAGSGWSLQFHTMRLLGTQRHFAL